MSTNRPTNQVNGHAQVLDLDKLAKNYKFKIEIASPEDTAEKSARIEAIREDGKIKRLLTLLLVPATFALCAWAVLSGMNVGQALLTSAGPAILVYLFGTDFKKGDK